MQNKVGALLTILFILAMTGQAQQRPTLITNIEVRHAIDLNGQKLGRHEGGFTPFNFEITNLVREKDNFLVIKVDNKRRRDAVPTLNTDWWNYGGLTRDVNLVEVPDTFIEDYFLQLKKGSTDEISGWIKLNSATAGKVVTVEIPEASVKQSATTDA